MANSITSLAEDFGQLVKKQPDAIAVIDGMSGAEITYRQLSDLLARAETFLRKSGAERSDPILMLLQNSLEAWILILAALRYGYDLAPFGNTGSEPEITAWRKLVGSKLVICPEGFAGVEGARAIEVPADGELSWLPEADGKAPAPRSCRLMLATSGTTGAPKAMVIDSDTLWSAGKAFTREHKFLDADTRFMNYLPMSYLGGIFNLGLIPMATGGSTVLLEAFNGKSFFSFWQNVERFEANTLWLVPSIARGLLQLEQKTQASKGPRKKVFGRVRAAFIGTAPIDLKTKQAFTECFGIALLENYALSETTFLTSESLYGGERQDRSVGKALPYVELRLAQAGADGSPYREIEVKTPFLFKGYLDAEGRLQPPELRDGFFPTKDLARLTDDGLVVMGGRTRDIIKKGGYFVGLREIEVIAEQNPSVAEAVAVGVAHDFYGEDYVLFVQFKPETADQNAALSELRTYLTGHLAKQKWPMKVSAVTDIPRTASGKVVKHRLLDNLGANTAPIAELP
jgi:acyl-CoA synthetase (AMP-forming)/AMP-acid ligase II